MTNATRCRAKNPAACKDPNCPDRKVFYESFMRAEDTAKTIAGEPVAYRNSVEFKLAPKENGSSSNDELKKVFVRFNRKYGTKAQIVYKETPTGRQYNLSASFAGVSTGQQKTIPEVRIHSIRILGEPTAKMMEWVNSHIRNVVHGAYSENYDETYFYAAD